MADEFTGSNYYKRSLTEYEVEACKRDAAKRAQGCNECSLTEYEVNPYDQQSETYSHIFTAAPGAPVAKIERRAELDAEIPALEAEIAAATEAKTKRNHKLAAMDAEIAALEAELATAKTKRNHKLAAMDAEIAALEAELAASKTKPNALET
jgi:septal ring factor EnvC (AmiA/AmiB activator)